MAVPNMTAAHEDAVHPALKGLQDVVRGDGPGTHDPDDADVGRVLQPADPCQVSCGIGSPGAEEADNLGFKRFSTHKNSLLALSLQRLAISFKMLGQTAVADS